MAGKKNGKTLDWANLRKLAVEAEVDPRTIKKELSEPGSVLGMSGDRAREVLIKHGRIAAPQKKASAA